MLGISKIQFQDRSSNTSFRKSTQKFKTNNYLSFGRSADFNELQKITIVTNFFGLHPSVAVEKVARSIKGLPEVTAETNPALKTLNQGFRNLLNALRHDDDAEVTSAVVKSFDIPSDSATKMDEVKDFFKQILFDSTEESRNQPDNIYKTFMLKLTKNLTAEKKVPKILSVDESLLESTGLSESKMNNVLAPVKQYMPVDLSGNKRKEFINNLFSLKGDELKNHFAQAVEALPPVETETQPQLKNINILIRSLSEKLAEQEQPYLPYVVSELLPIKNSLLPVDERLNNALLKVEKEQSYIPFYKKLTDGLYSSKKATKAQLEAEGIIIGKPKEVKKTQKKVKITKKQQAAIQRQKIIEDAILNIEKKKIELVEIANNSKKYKAQLKGINTELERLENLKDHRSINSETFNVESQRQTYIERISELEGRKSKLGFTEYNAKLEKLKEKHDGTEISDKRILNKMGRYEFNASQGVEEAENQELIALRKEFAEFSEKNPSIEDLNHRIKFVDKLLNFDEHYAKISAKLNKPVEITKETKELIIKLNSQIFKLETENKPLLYTIETLEKVDGKFTYVKIDYKKKLADLETKKPQREDFSTIQGFNKARQNWNLKLAQTEADQILATKYLNKQKLIDELTAQVQELEKPKELTKSAKEELQKLEIEKAKVERYLTHVDEKTGKTGRQKLEAKSIALKTQLENKLSGTQNKNGTYISGMRNIWDLSAEIANLKVKQNTAQTRLEAEQIKYANVDRQKGSLEKVILRKSKGQKKFVDEAKASIVTKELGQETKETPLEEIANKVKKKPVAKSASARANANALSEDTSSIAPTKTYKMTEAQEKELEKLKAELKEFDENEAKVRSEYNKYLYLLCGGSREDYGLTAVNRIIVDNKRISDLKKVEGEGEERAKKLIGKILRNTLERHTAEPERIGFYEQLEILEEKINKAQGQDLIKLEKEHASLKEEMAEVESKKQEITEKMSILSKERIALQKEMNKIEYGIKED